MYLHNIFPTFKLLKGENMLQQKNNSCQRLYVATCMHVREDDSLNYHVVKKNYH